MAGVRCMMNVSMTGVCCMLHDRCTLRARCYRCMLRVACCMPGICCVLHDRCLLRPRSAMVTTFLPSRVPSPTTCRWPRRYTWHATLTCTWHATRTCTWHATLTCTWHATRTYTWHATRTYKCGAGHDAVRRSVCLALIRINTYKSIRRLLCGYCAVHGTVVCLVWDTMPRGIRHRAGYRAAWDTVPCRVGAIRSRRSGSHAAACVWALAPRAGGGGVRDRCLF